MFADQNSCDPFDDPRPRLLWDEIANLTINLLLKWSDAALR